MLSEVIVRLCGGIFALKDRANSSKSKIMKKLYSNFYYYYLQQNSSYIGLTANFKNTPCLPHGVNGIFISGGAQIGENCVIFPNVIIGSNMLSDSKRVGAPQIGDNCYIGAGATIVGNVKIGNNCRIGANTTIFKDLPDYAVALCQEPKVFVDKTNDNTYYTFKNGVLVFYRNGEFCPVKNKNIVQILGNK